MKEVKCYKCKEDMRCAPVYYEDENCFSCSKCAKANAYPCAMKECTFKQTDKFLLKKHYFFCKYVTQCDVSSCKIKIEDSRFTHYTKHQCLSTTSE